MRVPLNEFNQAEAEYLCERLAKTLAPTLDDSAFVIHFRPNLGGAQDTPVTDGVFLSFMFPAPPDKLKE